MTKNQFENGYALLIGVGSDDIWQTAKDAERIGAILTGTDPETIFPKAFVGYPDDQVIVLTQDKPVSLRSHGGETIARGATKEGIVTALQWLAEQSDMESSVVVYFAGHGIDPSLSAAEDGEEFYLKPYDHEATQPEKALKKTEFIALLNGIISKKLMVFMGSCHAAEFTHLGAESPAGAEKHQFISEQEMVHALDAGAGKMFLASCHAHDKSFIKVQENYSVFGQTIIEALLGEASDPDYPYVTMLRIADHVMTHIPKKLQGSLVDQTPIFNGRNAENIDLFLNLRYRELDYSHVLTESERSEVELREEGFVDKVDHFLDLIAEMSTRQVEQKMVKKQLAEIETRIQQDLAWFSTYKNGLLGEQANETQFVQAQKLRQRFNELLEEKKDIHSELLVKGFPHNLKKKSELIDEKIALVRALYNTLVPSNA